MTPADRYESVIGLEIHAQLLTASKAFCGCSADFGSDPNTSVCPICLGMPGTLPVLNIRLVDSIIRMGLAVECTIASRSVFARKNYFYPDLPKGYQISQFEAPICTGGGVEIELQDGSRKRIGITRIHMEEDAGKSIHDQGAETLVDINRCGVPLIEIVSEPEMRSPAEAVAYLAAIRQLVTYLGICDGNMEEGSLRCDANVSVRQRGERALGTKTEVKNMNSFRNVERALAFEIQRQIGVLDDGGRIVQETLLWDADRNVAFPMRSKEEAHDYRYFPEPDLVPLAVDASWIARAKASLPELPAARRARFMEEFGLPRYDAGVLTADRSVADYFEETVSLLNLSGTRPTQENAKAASNWVMTDVLRVIGPGASGFPVTPRRLASLIGMVQEGRISGSIGRRVFDLMVTDTALPEEIVQQQGLAQVSDAAAIERAVEEVLGAHAGQVGKYLGGAEKIFGFFVGETMRQLKGKGNPKLIHEILKQKLAAQRRA